MIYSKLIIAFIIVISTTLFNGEATGQKYYLKSSFESVSSFYPNTLLIGRYIYNSPATAKIWDERKVVKATLGQGIHFHQIFGRILSDMVAIECGISYLKGFPIKAEVTYSYNYARSNFKDNFYYRYTGKSISLIPALVISHQHNKTRFSLSTGIILSNLSYNRIETFEGFDGLIPVCVLGYYSEMRKIGH